MHASKRQLPASIQVSSAAPALSKKDRNKLKKLTKRLNRVQPENDRSGLLTRAEYEEYKSLATTMAKNDGSYSGGAGGSSNGNNNNGGGGTFVESTMRLGPSIHHRKRKRDGDAMVSEGAQHRDLLLWLLQQVAQQAHDYSPGSTRMQNACGRQNDEADAQQPTAKKPKRSSSPHQSEASSSSAPGFQNANGPSKVGNYGDSGEGNHSVPAWASIHNPGMIQQIAVLEVQVDTRCGEQSLEKLYTSLASLTGKNETSINDKKPQDRDELPPSIGLPTKWFQGHIPTSMSESLLYFSNSKDHVRTKNRHRGDTPVSSSRKDLFDMVADTLLLSQEEMMLQAYPQPIRQQAEHPETRREAVSVATKEGLLHHDAAIPTATASNDLQPPETIPLDIAIEYVRTNGVQIQAPTGDVESIGEKGNLYVCTSSHRTEGEPNCGPPTGNDSGRIFGLDCEMVRTTEGSELARVTLVQFESWCSPKDGPKSRQEGEIKTTTRIDCLVRPENAVVDYLTKHSGITREILEPIHTRLAQVQYTLAHFLTPTDILVGHSLENDLRALRYIHPRVVDTAIVFSPSHRRYKFSLRHLAASILKKDIQTGSHCSEEDAHVALELAIRKAYFGDDLRVPGGNSENRTSLLQKFSKTGNSDSLRNGGTPLTTVFIGDADWIQTHVTKYPNGSHAISYETPEDCKKAMLAWLKGHRKAALVWSSISVGSTTKSTPGAIREEQSFTALQTLVVSTQKVLRIKLSFARLVAFRQRALTVDSTRRHVRVRAFYSSNPSRMSCRSYLQLAF